MFSPVLWDDHQLLGSFIGLLALVLASIELAYIHSCARTYLGSNALLLSEKLLAANWTIGNTEDTNLGPNHVR